MICEQLRKYKEELHLTNQTLSDLSGVPLGTINRILSGQTSNPNWQTICDLASAKNISLDRLAEEDVSDNENPSGQRAGTAIEAKPEISRTPKETKSIEEELEFAFSSSCLRCRDAREHIKAFYERCIRYQRRWITALFIICTILFLSIITLLIYDIMTPEVGFFHFL